LSLLLSPSDEIYQKAQPIEAPKCPQNKTLQSIHLYPDDRNLKFIQLMNDKRNKPKKKIYFSYQLKDETEVSKKTAISMINTRAYRSESKQQ